MVGQLSGLPQKRDAGEGRKTGNPLFVVLRARRSCITEHRAISKALSIKMHDGPTPSGPGPSANPAFCAGLILLAVCQGLMQIRRDGKAPRASSSPGGTAQ
jgi:hypothetical protein